MWGALSTLGGSLLGSYFSAKQSANAASDASAAQQRSAQLGIDEQRRQFDKVQELLSPYNKAGVGAVTGQQDLLGLNGNEAQQNSINGIKNSSQYTEMAQQGEDAILQNSSATGGLRGGNTQGALAQFRPQLLNQLIDQQYQRLGGLTQIGQSSAAGVGSAAQNTGNAVTSLLKTQGNAQAGESLARGQANNQMLNGFTNALGTFIGGKF